MSGDKPFERLVAGHSPAHFASCLWHPHAGRGRRPARHSGTARPRAPGHYAALHATLDEACVAGVRPDTSQSEVAPGIPTGMEGSYIGIMRGGAFPNSLSPAP